VCCSDSYRWFGVLLSDHVPLRNLPEILSTAAEFDYLTPEIIKDDKALADLNTLQQKLIKDQLLNPLRGNISNCKYEAKWANIHVNTVLICMWLNRMTLEPAHLLKENNMNVILSKSMRMCEVMLELVADQR
jgi:hypothetical protein